MKVNEILNENVEDQRAEVVAAFEKLRSRQKLEMRQVQLFHEYDAAFDAAIAGHDPDGISELEYLEDMKEIIGFGANEPDYEDRGPLLGRRGVLRHR